MISKLGSCPSCGRGDRTALAPAVVAGHPTSQLAQLGHELRTPLNAMLGYSELLRQDDRLLDEHREMAEVIHTSGQHLLALINTIMTSANVSRDTSPLEEAPFNVRTVVLQVADLLRLRAAEKNLSLQVHADSSVPDVCRGDAGKLRQVLINLVGNALNYTEQGLVRVHLSAQEGPAAGSILLGLTVQDSGTGIAQADQARIFNEQVRVGEAPRLNRTGAGLGLAITRQLVERMGGTICVESAFGHGSAFRVDVPLSVGPTNPDAAARDVEPGPMRAGRALGDARHAATARHGAALPCQDRAPLTPADLATIPVQLRHDLTHAVTELEVVKVAELIQQVSQTDAPLAHQLGDLARKMRFSSLLMALQGDGPMAQGEAA